jgi:hypothetical protein
MAWHWGECILDLWTQTTLPPKPYEFSARVDSTEMSALGFQLPAAPQNDYQQKLSLFGWKKHAYQACGEERKK